MIKIILLVILSAVFSSSGQVWLKTASNKTRPLHSKNIHSYLRYMSQLLSAPRIWLGLGSMAVSLVIWLMAVSQADLSLVYPIGSVYYIFVLVLARLFLGEKLDKLKIVGTFFILMGILLIVKN